jgi:hypothetical protein
MKKLFAFLKTVLITSLLLGGSFPAVQADAYFTLPRQAAGDQPGEDTLYFQTRTITQTGGPALQEYVINGPPTPPLGYQTAAVLPLQPEQTAGIKTLPVPTYSWVFGCSAVSAAMIAAHYDRTGYANIYTGPTNGSVMPMDNSGWPTWNDGYESYPSNPLVATRSGLDGRVTLGSIDDYWVKYLGKYPDPYIGAWTEHAWGEAVGDYMKTSQSAYGNDDGATRFYNFLSGDALTCSQMETLRDPGDPANRFISVLDGTYGRKLFYQNKGYTVTDCYNQKTDNNGGGYTFARYKAEIDAGHPVLLNLSGHSIAGVGYDDSTNTVYLHDTWDFSLHAMPWGNRYQDMPMVSVSIVRLASELPLPFSKLSPEDGAAG